MGFEAWEVFPEGTAHLKHLKQTDKPNIPCTNMKCPYGSTCKAKPLAGAAGCLNWQWTGEHGQERWQLVWLVQKSVYSLLAAGLSQIPLAVAFFSSTSRSMMTECHSDCKGALQRTMEIKEMVKTKQLNLAWHLPEKNEILETHLLPELG